MINLKPGTRVRVKKNNIYDGPGLAPFAGLTGTVLDPQKVNAWAAVSEYVAISLDFPDEEGYREYREMDDNVWALSDQELEVI